MSLEDYNYYFYIVFGIAIITGGLLYSTTQDAEAGHTVWDCTFEESEVCTETELTKYQNCNAEDDRPRQEHCRTTDENIESVTMFTDPANYINAPMTDKDYDIESLDIGEYNAWDAEFLDNGNFLYTEMEGELVLHDGEDQLETAELNQTEKFGNTGLLGVAADPEFEQNRHVYLYYYTGEWRDVEPDPTDVIDPIYNRVSRFTFQDGELKNEKILADEIEGSSGHSGGRIDIGPDNKLYITTGDSEYVKTDHEELHQKVQDRDFLGGKILRTSLDGEIPEDNPFNDSYVYAEGLRNPQGLDFHPETGTPYISMHGPWRHDEINKIQPGKNYGWPAEKCGYNYQEHVEIETETTDPIYCFNEFTIAPSGTTFVDDENHPWYGYYFVTGLRGSMLYAVDTTQEEPEGEIFYIRETEEIDNRLRNVEYHNEALYLFGDGYGVGKLTPK